ncbi:MAG: uroporphyrinogen decarboxylase [Salibacteraceae bacterium]
MEITITDWIGYLASAIVFVSFLYKEVKTIRIINMVGAAIFVIYGFLLTKAYPIIAFNSGIIILHVYHLFFKNEK